jgi:hypothetical protein
MSRKSPVYLLASERSGTNLLRKLITQHQDVYFGPSPPHFLKHLFHREPYYGDLSIDRNFKELIRHSLKLCYLHFSPWDTRFDEEEVFTRYADGNFPERNIIYLSHLLMTMVARSKGYETYFSKDNHIHEFVFPILKYLPESRFIFLHRDPRDYALSQLKRDAQTDSLYKIAKLWRDEQIKCISAYHYLGNARCLRLSYESLINNDAAEIRRICAFLEVEYRPIKKNSEMYSGPIKEWENLDRNVMKDNSGKYKSSLGSLGTRLIESITRRQMEYLDYSPDFPSTSPVSKFYRGCELIYGETKSRVRWRFTKSESEDLTKKRIEFIKSLPSK